MTELSFLIELLLDHDVMELTKKKIAERIKEVEQTLTTKPQAFATNPIQNVPKQLQQSPSTLALMAKHGDIPPQPLPQETLIESVTVIAQTQAAAAAMARREESIAAALSGRVDKTTGKPRKW